MIFINVLVGSYPFPCSIIWTFVILPPDIIGFNLAIDPTPVPNPTTSKIGEEQLFYCNQRGIDTEDAIALIINGFCKSVFKKLPMEFAVEAQKLMEVSLEGSVG